jgi:hypothetical protein
MELHHVIGEACSELLYMVYIYFTLQTVQTNSRFSKCQPTQNAAVFKQGKLNVLCITLNIYTTHNVVECSYTSKCYKCVIFCILWVQWALLWKADELWFKYKECLWSISSHVLIQRSGRKFNCIFTLTCTIQRELVFLIYFTPRTQLFSWIIQAS